MEKIVFDKQHKAINSVFAELPQYMLLFIIALRVVVAVPLFIGELGHLSFFESNGLTVMLALFVVLTLEGIGLMASVLTAWFRGVGLREGFYLSLSIAVFAAAFNAYLLATIDKVNVNVNSQVVFQSFNLLSFVLGEAMGFLVVSMRTEPEPAASKEEIVSVSVENRNTDKSEIARTMRAEGYTFSAIAEKLNISTSTAHKYSRDA